MAQSSLWRRRDVLTSAALAMVVLVGCGGASPTTASSPIDESARAQAAASLPEYDGPEAGHFGTLPEPRTVPGYSFTVGILQVYGGVENLRTIESSAVEQIERLGGEAIVLDAQLNPQTQVSQFQQLITQRVDAIIVMPTTDGALQESLRQASDAGIPVVAWGVPTDKSAPANPLVTTSVNTGFDFADYSVMRELASRRPGSSFALLGTGLPSDQLQYVVARLRYWGERMGLRYLGEEQALRDDPGAYTPALQAIFTNHPDVENIITYNDESALTAATIAAQQGNTTVSIANPNSGQAIFSEALRAGRVTTGYYVPWTVMGQNLAIAAYSALTDQNQPLPEFTVIPSEVITRDNVDDFTYIG